MMDRKETVNEHLKNNSSSDTEDEVRMRRRMAEQEKQRQAGNQPQMGDHRDDDDLNSDIPNAQPG